MAERLKKWGRYIVIFLGIVIMIPTAIYLLLQIPAIQTTAVRKLTNRLSENLQSEISIRRVDYHFFNRLVLSGILFKDYNNDTLFYAEELSAGIRKLAIQDKDIRLGRIIISKPEFQLIKDTTGQMNLSWYISRLRTEPDSTKKSFNISIDRIDLENAKFALINHSDTNKTQTGKINFSDLVLDQISGTVEDFKISGDTTTLNLYRLAFTNMSGFSISELEGRLKLSGKYIMLESAYMHTDSSILNFSKISINATGPGGFSKFLTDVRLDIRSEESIINSDDLRYFVDLPVGIEESVTLSGRFNGTISELRGRDIQITYRDNTLLDCDFDISGLPEFENSFIYLGVNEFTTSVADLEKLKIPGRKNQKLPDVIYRLGTLSFRGSFSGFTTDFVTYGQFSTAIGDVNTDISLRPDKSGEYRMQGLLSGVNIDLGRISGSEILGLLSIHANVDGYASSFEKFAGDLKGSIDSIEINDYNYRNIGLTGTFTEDTWDGSINVADQNIRMSLMGIFNFSDTLPVFDFSLDLAEADLYNLKIDKSDSTSALSLKMTSNFKGTNIDNLDGEIRLLSSNLTKHNDTIELNDFSIRTFIENNKSVLSLKTGFLDAEINGKYSFSGLKKTFSTVLSSLMPSLGRQNSQATGSENNFSFNLNFKNTNRINEFFQTGLVLAENSFVRGSVLPDTVIRIEGSSDFLVVRNIRFNNIELNANADRSIFEASINTSSLLLPGNTTLRNMSVKINTEPDTAVFIAEWNNNEKILNSGQILATGFISRVEGSPVMRIDIDSSLVYANNNLWKIDNSSIKLDTGSVRIDDINVSSRDRFYHINGAVSRSTEDTLHLAFSGIDISPLNHLTGRQKESYQAGDTSKFSMNMRGRINGDIALTNVFVKPLIESDVSINDFSILGSDYGTITINSEFDYARKVVDISAANNIDGVTMFDVGGYYDPSAKRFLLNILVDDLPVGILNRLLSSFASDISGFASGRVQLLGSKGALFMNGALMAQKVNMRINYLQTLYTINDSIRFDNQGFRFNNVKFSDEEGRLATIDGIVRHRNFRNYTADLTINMGNDFKVLNTQLKDNSSFYGTVYASGVTKINTSPDLLSFDIAASTGRNTQFSIPLSDELSVSEYSFINFVDASGNNQKTVIQANEPLKQLGFNINIDLEVTSDAMAEIIFDEKVGDKITGSGTGMLNINLNPKGDFKITGDYVIERGDYLFTLGNILNKRFEVENGGTISFNGDLDNAEIDLRAIYQKFNTSLGPILQDPDRNERVSVEPQLVLSGRLFNPTVRFEINLPDSDEETKTYLRNAIATDEELSRQFMYLLVMKSFYAESSASQYSSSSTGTTAMAATTFEMVANQFSNWISQINDNFNLGINYQPGTGNRSLNPDELQLAFETQIFDDRVTLNGNFDYRSTTSGSSTDQLTGDFEADIRLTEKVRFKVFNRFNDISTGKGPYTQGIGIFFKRDFEKLSDLFRRKTKETAKREEEISVKDDESVVNK